MHKPWHTLIFALLFFLGLGLISWYFPQPGFQVKGDFSVRFPAFKSLFQNHDKKADISKVLKIADQLDEPDKPEGLTDESNTADTSFVIAGTPSTKKQVQKRDSLSKLITGIQMRSPAAMQAFFDALMQLEKDPSVMIRVLHYGDSQIEGDRITDQLREKLQKQFGGSGPGLVSLMPLTQSIINKINTDGSWERFSAGIGKDKRVAHTAYGPLAGFSRFSAYKKISDTSSFVRAAVTVTTTRGGGSIALGYKKIKLFFGGAKRKTWCEYYDGPALMAADSLQANGSFNVREFTAGNGSFVQSLKFRSKDSPDFYGMSLEGNSGIMVDNIALRGSSGTFFHLINQQQMKQFYDYLNVKLIILQFGGNALPFITNDTIARNYASWMRNQISIVKKLAPGASILFIGPSDMDVKEGNSYVTHPYLEITRDALKKMALESNCAFFDLYDCMGGRNSMSAWVDEKLAATDYIHFSPQGARKISALLHAALINEYNNYKKRKN